MSITIKVENVSKAYQLGQIGTGTISRDLERWYARIRGKEDPFLRIGENNDQNRKSESNVVWSLKDINFDIEQGDAVGIIGRNGAGKSTLLKILSKVTAPTTGKIYGKGRIASLLEVGTGFHPELSGKENIFLNGAILGMRKKEIQRKLDEIVYFAGIERYLDTPVKRYSSGMYVRLAFAVAAHLESEILIVDEVLAVGDAEFQKKCLGKMSDVSKSEGRTVLFVSHNMGAIRQLCQKGIVLKNGLLSYMGPTKLAVTNYLNEAQSALAPRTIDGTLKGKIIFKSVSINEDEITQNELLPTDPLKITIKGQCLSELERFRVSLSIFKEGERIFTMQDAQIPLFTAIGNFTSVFIIPNNLLRPGQYFISIGGHDGNHLGMGNDWIFGKDVASFTIAEDYSYANDFANEGFINVPFNAKRENIS